MTNPIDHPIFTFPASSFLLFGPRGTGKSTFLHAMYPVSAALKYGLIPLIVESSDANARLNAYLTLYLKEEVQAEGMVRNTVNFSRFLQSISFSHGSILNISEVARDCEVGRKTVEGYLDILEDLLLAFRIPVFSKRAKRNLIKHEKLYYFDAGVFRSIRPKGPLDRVEEIEGVALEGLVAQHLRAWCAYGKKTHQYYYWRTKSGSEVDFIIYGEACFVALEVKRAAKINNKDLQSLKNFKDDYPEAMVGLLYLGKEKLNNRPRKTLGFKTPKELFNRNFEFVI